MSGLTRSTRLLLGGVGSPLACWAPPMEGDSRRAGLVQKAEDRDDLIAKKPLRGERVHRLLERRQELYDPDALSESDEMMCTSESDEDSGDY